jgi:HemY protein
MWLLPVWDGLFQPAQARVNSPGVALVQALQASLSGLDAQWLARFEAAHQLQPNDAQLQYLAGMACRERQLWGKAQQHLSKAAPALEDSGLARTAWRTLAELAEQSGDEALAIQAWKRAAQL